MIKRVFDLMLASLTVILLAPLMLCVALAIRLDSAGPAVFWSQRFGRDGRLFLMPKFRTMHIDTPLLPTHLLRDGASRVTRLGRFLRRTSLDELPQFFSVIAGDMSLVGPRPALFNQDDLMRLRAECGVAALRPGITGWAQINGRDELTISEKVTLEREYLARMSLAFDVKILILTIVRVLDRRSISH